MAKLDLKGCTFSGNAIGITLPKDSGLELRLDQVQFNGNGIAIEERDDNRIIHALGLPSDTPVAAIREAVAALSNKGDDSIEDQVAAVKKTSLMGYLGVGANIATIVGALLPFITK